MWKKSSLVLILAWGAAAQQQQQQATGSQQGTQRQQGGRQAAQAPATGSGSIAGRILDSAGAPVRRAVVTVEGETRSARTGKAMTGDDGTYVIGSLPKGKYWITAEKTGFLRRGYRARSSEGYGDPVELAEDTAKTGIDIQLPRQGVILGRVLDEAGEPAERVMVQAIPVRKSNGRGGANSTTTNDLGEFRLPRLAPGNYRLLASRAMDRGQVIVDRVPGKQAMAEAPTYFPAAIDAATATPIRVNAGEERAGAEIRLQRSTVVRLAGRVSGELPAGRGARVNLHSNSEVSGFRGGFMPGGGNDGAVDTDGSFEFRNVRPGEYTLTVMSMDRGGPKTLGRTVVAVGQQDIGGVTINTAAAPKVDGRVRADGEPPFAIGTVNIMLQSAEGGRQFGPPLNAKTDEAGNFSFPAVSREPLILNVRPPAGVIVKDVYAAGQLLPGLEIDFATVTGPLEIVLSNKPATITGVVEGTTPDAPRVAVWAVPETNPLVAESWNVKKVRVFSDSPTFTLDSLRPGSYRIAAIEDIESDVLNDAAVWSRIQNQTASVRVGEGESTQVKVKLIPAKELEEK